MCTDLLEAAAPTGAALIANAAAWAAALVFEVGFRARIQKRSPAATAEASGRSRPQRSFLRRFMVAHLALCEQQNDWAAGTIAYRV